MRIDSRKSILAIAIGVMALPLLALAHGGFQKQAGSVTVYVNQDPVSPLVGELVNVSIQLQQGDVVLPGVEVSLSLIDTAFNDPANDKAILSERKITDANGAFSFSHTFEKQNYFDLDLKFVDPATGQETSTGFLIQPRQVPDNRRWPVANSALVVILGLAVANLLYQRKT